MIRTTFNRLRELKDSLPHGSMNAIADELGLAPDDVRNFFRCDAGIAGNGYHIEPGPEGGIVIIDNTRILEVALRIAWANKHAL